MSEEIEKLRSKIQARENKPGYGANVEELKRRLAELEAQGG